MRYTLQSLKIALFKKCRNTAWKPIEKLKLITKNYLINVKEGRKERTEEQEADETNKITKQNVRPKYDHISNDITEKERLQANGKDYLTGLKKSRITYILFKEMQFKYKYTNNLEIKNMGKDMPWINNPKETGMAVLIPDKTDFKATSFTRNKEGI